MATYKPLSTDFKDDILASQNSKRKYTQVNNSDGTVSFQDSTAYSQVGSSYGAKEVNEEREAINNIYANKLVTLDEIDLVTEPGFFVDAQVVKELNSKMPIITSMESNQQGVINLHGLKIVYGVYPLHAFVTDQASGGYKATINIASHHLTGNLWCAVTPRYPLGHPYVSAAEVTPENITLLSDATVQGAYAAWMVIGVSSV